MRGKFGTKPISFFFPPVRSGDRKQISKRKDPLWSSKWFEQRKKHDGEGEREREKEGEVRDRYSNDPLFPAKSLDDVIDNYEMIREA